MPRFRVVRRIDADAMENEFTYHLLSPDNYVSYRGAEMYGAVCDDEASLAVSHHIIKATAAVRLFISRGSAMKTKLL